MELNVRYTNIIDTIVKDGRGFTTDDGTKYTKYRIKFQNYSLSFPAYLRKDLTLESGDKISFKVILNGKKKFQLSQIEIINYDIKHPLRVQPH